MTVRLCVVNLLLGCGLPVSAAAIPPTFSKDVAPILYSRCLECHRQGEAAPMAFTSYSEIRPWAKAIKQAVLSRKMPPWLADPHFGAFRNDRRMPEDAIQTIVAWVDAGAPEGDSKQTPKLPQFETGWRIGKPDAIFDIGTEYDVPAEGVVAYKYFTVPTNFTEDKWVEAAEVRPDQRGAVHHIIVFVKEPANTSAGPTDSGNILVGYAPGENPLKLMPGTAVLVKAGSSLYFQVHYTPNGKAVKDRSYSGVRFAREAPKYRAIRGLAHEFLQLRQQPRGAKPGARGDLQRAAWGFLNILERFFDGAKPRQHVRYGPVKELALIGEGQSACMALEKRRRDFFFQRADLPAHCRLA